MRSVERVVIERSHDRRGRPRLPQNPGRRRPRRTTAGRTGDSARSGDVHDRRSIISDVLVRGNAWQKNTSVTRAARRSTRTRNSRYTHARNTEKTSDERAVLAREFEHRRAVVRGRLRRRPRRRRARSRSTCATVRGTKESSSEISQLEGSFEVGIGIDDRSQRRLQLVEPPSRFYALSRWIVFDDPRRF